MHGTDSTKNKQLLSAVTILRQTTKRHDITTTMADKTPDNSASPWNTSDDGMTRPLQESTPLVREWLRPTDITGMQLQLHDNGNVIIN